MKTIKELALEAEPYGGLCFEIGEEKQRPMVKVHVPGALGNKFNKKKHFEFFEKLAEILFDENQEMQDERYAGTQVQGSLFDAIKNRKEAQNGDQ